MARVVVIAAADRIAQLVVSRMRRSPAVEYCQMAPGPEDGFGGGLGRGYAGFFEDQGIDSVVYFPPLGRGKRMTPDLADAVEVFEQCARAGVERVIVVSSAAVYGASAHNTGLMPESRLPAHNGKNPV